MKRNLKILTYLLVFNFILVFFTLTYWQVIRKEAIFTHPRNKRLSALEQKTWRGKILDRHGKTMAVSEKVDDSFVRRFPYGEMAAHLVGYNSPKYGRAGLEFSANAELLGLPDRQELLPFLPDLITERQGYDVVTTIDMDLQQLAFKLLGDRKGAVAAVDPRTGQILTLVSRPSYNPGEIEKNWTALQQEGNGSPLLNRAAQGLYPPGSTLKVVTGAGALKYKPATWERIFDAPGYIIVKGNRIEDKQVVGKVDFIEALQRSSNYVFATLGLEMGANNFYKILSEFGLAEKISLGLPTSRPVIAPPEKLVPEALAETSIGQGKTLVTPLHMAMVAATVANKGVIEKPNLIKAVSDQDGQVVSEGAIKTGQRVITEDNSNKMVEAMEAVVKAGTGQQAGLPGVKVAGKTGSAENPHGITHAWFIGFAPVDDPQIALAVIVENGGAGGRVAAPIARELFKAAINNKR